jgi:uridine monophosphate synthetase
MYRYLLTAYCVCASLHGDGWDPVGLDIMDNTPLPKMDTAPVVLKLFDMGALQLKPLPEGGTTFTLSLKRVVLTPSLLTAMADLMWESAAQLDFDVVCGVPYGALPLSTVIALRNNKPIILSWKEPSESESFFLIQGAYNSGDKVLLVAETASKAAPILPVVQVLTNGGLNVPYTAVFLDLEDGTTGDLASHGIEAMSVVSVSQVKKILVGAGKIDANDL